MSMNSDEMVQAGETAAPTGRGRVPRKRLEMPVGGLPTVSLLPRELRVEARAKAIRRGLILALVVAVIVAGGATAAASAISGIATAQLASANERSQMLVQQLAKFRDVQALQQGIALGTAAKTVGSSTEIDWQAQIDAIEQNMPAGYAVSTIVADSATPLMGYQQGTTPLEQPRAATATLTVTTDSILELPVWLRKLRSIPAYADATATVSSSEESGYTVLLVVHLSPKSLVNAKVTK